MTSFELGEYRSEILEKIKILQGLRRKISNLLTSGDTMEVFPGDMFDQIQEIDKMIKEYRKINRDLEVLDTWTVIDFFKNGLKDDLRTHKIKMGK